MPANKKRRLQDESDGEPQVTKKSKAKNEVSRGKDAEGNAYWGIGSNRRVSASQFKGTTLVNIREYYTAPDGELKPGKKGISLSLDQYKALLKVTPELNEELRSQGHALESPPVERAAGGPVEGEKPAKSKPKKSNIEETSEEEENDGD